MTDVVCPDCTVKTGRPDKSGLFKRCEGELCWLVCLKCGWQTEPFARHADIALPTEQELKDNYR